MIPAALGRNMGLFRSTFCAAERANVALHPRFRNPVEQLNNDPAMRRIGLAY
ncbi:hypothetical protein [Afipia sp. Root123D2]|uniref:hypothetical protein n=1 Tax=Afipia sp. Root123D2 TaxID=1736436 RepID=UPI0012E7898D|nr:hypothetical protein [Afipia sp. Root123D2]